MNLIPSQLDDWMCDLEQQIKLNRYVNRIKLAKQYRALQRVKDRIYKLASKHGTVINFGRSRLIPPTGGSGVNPAPMIIINREVTNANICKEKSNNIPIQHYRHFQGF